MLYGSRNLRTVWLERICFSSLCRLRPGELKLNQGTFDMPTKREEDPERGCIVFRRQWPWTLPICLVSSSLRQEQEGPSRVRPQRAYRRPDSGGERNPPRPGVYEFPKIPLEEDVAILISVIEGASKGLTHRLSKLCITAGRIGGGADFEFDEPEASDVHCIIAAREKGVRLYVAPSANNIFVNDRRICTVELGHLSTFRIGSSLLLITVFPTA
jgi:hypothetical protein